MTRQIVLDTETTGLAPEEGHRIVEIGLVELRGRRRTGRTFHTYLDPERDIDAAAEKVHGLSRERLTGEPKFAAVVDRLLDFVAGAEILIHNAPFDIAFLDAEIARLGREPFRTHCAAVIDTLAMAREMRPGQRNSLDVLCSHFGVSNEHRTLHGALLDAELLAEVYLQMTRGQESFAMFGDEGKIAAADALAWPLAGSPPVLRPSAEEIAAHEALLADMEQAGGAPIWSALSAGR
ncbi:MAG: DNA polymerase III subunit epsilon [Burkholderiaceae bacterium]